MFKNYVYFNNDTPWNNITSISREVSNILANDSVHKSLFYKGEMFFVFDRRLLLNIYRTVGY